MTAFIMRARTLGTSFVLVAAICQLMGKAASHGLIAYPPMRTAFTPFFGANDCPYCLNGGGTAKQSGERSIQWEDVYPTKALINPCGDPPGDDRNLYGSFPTTNLDIADGTFPIKFVITTNHWGRIMYRLFTNPNDLNTDKHYVLERADGKGTAVHPPLEDGGNGDGMRALGTATSADWLGGWGQLYESQFRWPAGVTCEPVCVIQMEWVTGHSCTPAGVPDSAAKYYGGQPAVPCSKPGSPWPEVFLNCADVIVGGGGQAARNTSTSSTASAANTPSTPAPPSTGIDRPVSSSFKGEEPVVVALSGPRAASSGGASGKAPTRSAGSLADWSMCGDAATMPYDGATCAAGSCMKMDSKYAKCVPTGQEQYAQGGTVLYVVA